MAEFCAYRREGHCCFEILPIYWFLLASKGLRAIGTQDYEQYGSGIQGQNRGEHRPLDLGQYVLMVGRTGAALRDLDPFGAVYKFEHWPPGNFRARVTLRH